VRAKAIQVSACPDNFYAQWRARHGLAPVLRDAADAPPERLLQAIWQHQRLRRDRLKTLDGETVRVLHPGFGSAGSGPDFGGAVIQFGDDPPISGDVEVDVRTGGWYAHGHDKNHSFKEVILHVVWNGGGSAKSRTALRTLALQDALDAPLGELSLWLVHEPAKSLPENCRGKCAAPLRDLNDEQLNVLLREAALVRFQAKAEHCRARARHAGWEQSLWEGLLRALGYRHNVWPMQCLAETRSRWLKKGDSPLTLQSRLLGISGLLPVEPGKENYVRRLWDHWWRDRNEFEDCALPRSVWRFHGLRPSNHPQRRLALASHWLSAGDLPEQLQRWCAADVSDSSLLGSLVEILHVSHDDFWSWHRTLRSARLSRPEPLLGEKRVTDIAVNAILPWLFARASEGHSQKLVRNIERRYFGWQQAEDNAVLRLARERLLGGAKGRLPRKASAQQGLMQIVKDFCEHSNAVCDNCGFPELVKARFR
jgi:Protein of unknown function (DUF2851)